MKMHRVLLHSYRTAMAAPFHLVLLPRTPWRTLYSSSTHQQQQHQHKQEPHVKPSPIGSPSRVQKLIASQSDPLLAKEIFDLASLQPNFKHSYSSFHILILKLGWARQFSLMQDLLMRLKSEQYSINPSLFSDIIEIYGEANLPDQALKTFHSMLQFHSKPLPKHLNRLLQLLVSHRNYIRPAFDLFKSAHRYGVSPDTKSYNILMSAFCFNGDLSIAYTLFNQMFKRDVAPDVESYRILMQGLCRKSQVNRAVDLLEDMLNKGYVPDALSYTTFGLCDQGLYDEAKNYVEEMLSKGFSLHFSVFHALINGFCNVGKLEEACEVLREMLRHGEAPHTETWVAIIPRICEVDKLVRMENIFDEALKLEITPNTRLVEAGIGLEERGLELIGSDCRKNRDLLTIPEVSIDHLHLYLSLRSANCICMQRPSNI
ncbi:unnamed protein product, partial [Vitis vinifera]